MFSSKKDHVEMCLGGHDGPKPTQLLLASLGEERRAGEVHREATPRAAAPGGRWRSVLGWGKMPKVRLSSGNRGEKTMGVPRAAVLR